MSYHGYIQPLEWVDHERNKVLLRLIIGGQNLKRIENSDENEKLHF